MHIIGEINTLFYQTFIAKMIKQIVREIGDLPALLVPKNEIDPQMNIPRENHIV